MKNFYMKMKLKRLIILILVITMLVPVTHSTNSKEVSAASTFRIKGYTRWFVNVILTGSRKLRRNIYIIIKSVIL